MENFISSNFSDRKRTRKNYAHQGQNPRAARRDNTHELYRHFSSQIGHLEAEFSASPIHSQREEAMKDAEENYDLIMEFHRELANEFEKVISKPDQ